MGLGRPYGICHTTQLCCYTDKTAIDKTKIKRGGSVSIILYLQKQEMGWIWPAGHLPTSLVFETSLLFNSVKGYETKNLENNCGRKAPTFELSIVMLLSRKGKLDITYWDPCYIGNTCEMIWIRKVNDCTPPRSRNWVFPRNTSWRNNIYIFQYRVKVGKPFWVTEFSFLCYT